MFSAIVSMFSNFIHLILGINTPQSFPPPLPAEKEAEYFRRLEEGDTSARETLILHNLRLVSHIVRKYYASSKNQEDLVSVGVIGLVKAVDSFKISNGARFATYSAKCIQNEILMYFRSQKKLNAEVSLNETIDVDREGNPLTYIDVISCDESITGEVERKINSQRALKYVNTLLDERERQIITLRYGLNDNSEPMTQREVAEILGISRSYVSRIEKTALEKLLAAFKEI
ncbi:MAG: RNA polymerase sporulation sigma factor SigK [Clostridia bacterium]|nr:RNA polymerase sporulation sigma factor SigK [Clostridia bacterium]